MNLMRSVLCAAVLSATATAAAALAQSKPQPAAPDSATNDRPVLNLGDPAPALAIEHWVKGEPVKGFEKGKVYIVEFWATWCVPCVRNMPHLTELQSKHKDKGLTVIGVSSSDQRGVEDVRPFVEKNGDKMGYTVAVDDNKQTAARYMAATGQTGIPVAYIVDRDSKLAWYGHPATMDDVLAKVLDGSFDTAKHAANEKRFAEIGREFAEATQAEDWDRAEKLLDEVKVIKPEHAAAIEYQRIGMRLIGKKDKAGALDAARAVLVNYKDDAQVLRTLGTILASTPALEPSDQTLTVQIAERVVTLTDGKDAASIALLADAWRAGGDWDKAEKTLSDAIERLDDEAAKQVLRMRLNQIKTDRPAAAGKDAAGQDAKPTDD